MSSIITYGLATTTQKAEVEISDLPPLLQKSRWTFYLDDLVASGTRGVTCINKWMGSLRSGEVATVNVRPDGYVTSVRRWSVSTSSEGEAAGQWLNEYFGSFLEIG